MIHTSSYSIEFKNNLRAVKNTVLLYREAVEYLIAPVKDHYEELEKIKGHKSSEIEGILGEKTYDEVIHRDDLVIL